MKTLVLVALLLGLSAPAYAVPDIEKTFKEKPAAEKSAKIPR